MRAQTRSPSTVGIGAGREACARRDLRMIVTYSQIFTVLGLQLLILISMYTASLLYMHDLHSVQISAGIARRPL